jgi:hypothetical protein
MHGYIIRKVHDVIVKVDMLKILRGHPSVKNNAKKILLLKRARINLINKYKGNFLKTHPCSHFVVKEVSLISKSIKFNFSLIYTIFVIARSRSMLAFKKPQ